MKKGHALSPIANSLIKRISDTSRFLTRYLIADGFFSFSSCSTNFLFLLRHFFALLTCGTSDDFLLIS